MKYDFIIILCPDEKGKDGKFSEFKDGRYLGGQTRMDAAVELYKIHPEVEYIVVGGYDPEKETSKKILDMKCFLKEKCSNINISPIKSLPCTKHNFIAIFNTWKKEKVTLQDKNIGLLTNLYHLPRALRFAAEVRIEIGLNDLLQLVPICAESVIKDMKRDNIYTSTTEYLLRLESERQGLRDLENGNYDDNCLGKNRRQFIEIAKKYPNILLTAEERNQLGVG